MCWLVLCAQSLSRRRRRHAGTEIALETDERGALAVANKFFVPHEICISITELVIDFIAPDGRAHFARTGSPSNRKPSDRPRDRCADSGGRPRACKDGSALFYWFILIGEDLWRTVVNNVMAEGEELGSNLPPGTPS